MSGNIKITDDEGMKEIIRKFGKDKYNQPKKLDSIQHPPDQMTVVDFKQDYVVLVRKKLYYAINTSNNERYLKIFQINNFMSVRTSHSTNGRSSASFVIRGAERVIVSDREGIVNSGIADFDALIRDWTNIDRENEGNSLTVWNGIEYGSELKSREYKYDWAYAEKCDFEPMDEVYIFSKSRRQKDNEGKYVFKQIFFGYISTIKKDFNPERVGPMISIQVEDHLKLLQVSRMANRPSANLTTAIGSSYVDPFGNWVLENDVYSSGYEIIKEGNTFKIKPTPTASAFLTSGLFAGRNVTDVIVKLCFESGIPVTYLNKRIEKIDRAPWAIQMRTPDMSDLFSGDYGTRLSYCQKAAEILNLEFFADEEGNIVFKIPTFNIGINELTDNNCGYSLAYSLNSSSSPLSNMYNQFGKKTIAQNDQQSLNTYDFQIKAKSNVDSQAKIAFQSMVDEVKNIGNQMNDNVFDDSTVGGENASNTKDKKTTSNGKRNPNLVQYEHNTTIKGNSNQNRISSDGPLSQKTDNLIPVVFPNEIMSFSFTHSDKDVYTAAQVTAEIPFIQASMSGIPETITRAIQDKYMIVKYGLRVFPPVTTPLVGGPEGAQIYAAMLLMKGYSNMFTGSLTMLEESTIKVGDPIRLNLYDENPFPENYRKNEDDANNFGFETSQSGPYNAQAVFYVESIDRNIQPDKVSTMTLNLRGGRIMGQSSLFDNAPELFKYYNNTSKLPSANDGKKTTKPTTKTNS